MEQEFNSCLYFTTNHLSRLLSKMADEAFKMLGLSPSYAFLLMAVHSRPGIQPSELSDILGLTPSTITRLIEKMEYQGYLERQSEGRATHVYPTQKCIDRQDELQSQWQQLQNRYTSVLGERYTEVLTEMSTKAIDRLQEA